MTYTFERTLNPDGTLTEIFTFPDEQSLSPREIFEAYMDVTHKMIYGIHNRKDDRT